MRQAAGGRRWLVVLDQRRVVVEVTADGFLASCPGTDVVGRGASESEAWSAFWAAVRADWRPPGFAAVAGRSAKPAAGSTVLRSRIRTIRVRDLFG
uniref:hypothetical protein n=1 Tax=Kitasatospora indigofera TaxID=67307 RepID=UPI002F913A7B